MRVRKEILLVIAVVMLFGLSAAASAEDWKLVSVTYATPKARLHTAVFAKKYDYIREIKLHAFNATVKVWNMTIHYRNGKRQSVPLHTGLILKDSDSQAINLEEEGGVKSITFFMNTVSFKGKSAGIWIYGGE